MTLLRPCLKKNGSKLVSLTHIYVTWKKSKILVNLPTVLTLAAAEEADEEGDEDDGTQH